MPHTHDVGIYEIYICCEYAWPEIQAEVEQPIMYWICYKCTIVPCVALFSVDICSRTSPIPTFAIFLIQNTLVFQKSITGFKYCYLNISKQTGAFKTKPSPNSIAPPKCHTTTNNFYLRGHQYLSWYDLETSLLYNPIIWLPPQFFGSIHWGVILAFITPLLLLLDDSLAKFNISQKPRNINLSIINIESNSSTINHQYPRPKSNKTSESPNMNQCGETVAYFVSLES